MSSKNAIIIPRTFPDYITNKTVLSGNTRTVREKGGGSIEGGTVVGKEKEEFGRKGNQELVRRKIRIDYRIKSRDKN